MLGSAGANQRARAAPVMNHLLAISQRGLAVLDDALITPFLPRYDLECIDVRTLILETADALYGTYDGEVWRRAHSRRLLHPLPDRRAYHGRASERGPV